MKITVKSHLNRYELFKEPENRFLGQTKKCLKGGCRLDILDSGGNLTASVRHSEEKLLVTDSQDKTFSCPMKYGESADNGRIQESLIRPPMPEQICFSTRQGKVCILSDVLPEACYSVIFALAFLMLHGDDIDII